MYQRKHITGFHFGGVSAGRTGAGHRNLVPAAELERLDLIRRLRQEQAAKQKPPAETAAAVMLFYTW